MKKAVNKTLLESLRERYRYARANQPDTELESDAAAVYILELERELRRRKENSIEQGRAGGRRRAEILTPERRSEIASDAANARWAGYYLTHARAAAALPAPCESCGHTDGQHEPFCPLA